MPNNVDDLLVAQQTNPAVVLPKPPMVKPEIDVQHKTPAPQPKPEAKAAEPAPAPVAQQPAEKAAPASEYEPAPEEKAVPAVPEVPETGEAGNAGENDEYGNPVGKPRMYTEEELNQRVRERLRQFANNNMPNKPTPDQINKAAEGFEADPNSTESWETQLESFVERTFHKVSQREVERQRAAEAQAIEAEFADRFHAGMARRHDFAQVLHNVPVTDAMMMGVRSLADPAAFIYAAAKNQRGELERISKIRDPYAQAAEMGRLEERMKRTHSKTTSAPRAPQVEKMGDMPEKAVDTRRNIDQMINDHAMTKRRG